jgi:hypothetical protein
MSGCAIALLAIAGSASASTLAVNQAGVLRLDATFGEVNGVTLREGTPFGTYDVADSAGLTAGPGCTQVSPTEGQCLITDAGTALIHTVVLHLGNRDDTSDVATFFGFTPVEVDGGFGDDVISGGAVGGYAAYGGPGDDTIDGVTTNGAPVDIDGGFGDDTVSTIGTFSTGSIRGGFGADHFVLNGNMGLTIDGGRGPDVITGNGLILGPVFGGPGRDTIDLPRATSIDCGFGRDSYGVYAGQTATRCERPLPPPSV